MGKSTKPTKRKPWSARERETNVTRHQEPARTFELRVFDDGVVVITRRVRGNKTQLRVEAHDGISHILWLINHRFFPKARVGDP